MSPRWRQREVVAGALLSLGIAMGALVLVVRASVPQRVADAPVVAGPERRAVATSEPEPSAELVAAEPEQRRKPALSTHVVESGESLRDIAAQYGLSPETLAAANGLRDPDLLRVGQQLIVPAVDGVLHTVLPGETLR